MSARFTLQLNPNEILATTKASFLFVKMITTKNSFYNQYKKIGSFRDNIISQRTLEIIGKAMHIRMEKLVGKT